MKYLFSGLLLFFYILNFLDAHSTYHVVKNTSLRSERNPVARWMFKKFGIIPGMIMLKSLIVFLTPLMIYYYKYDKNDILITLGVANAVFLFVVQNNYRIVNRISKK